MYTEGRWASELSFWGGLAGMVAAAALWSAWGHFMMSGFGFELLVIMPLAWWLHYRLGEEIGRRLDRIGEVESDARVYRAYGVLAGGTRSRAFPGARREARVVAPWQRGRPGRSLGRPHRPRPWWLQRSDYDWDLFHEQVVRESFRSASLREAVILVGLLYTCQIQLSPELRDLARTANQWTPGCVQPVALHEAVAIVSFLHGGRRGLREAFERDWVTLRDSEHARDVRHRLEGHRFIGALVPVDPF